MILVEVLCSSLLLVVGSSPAQAGVGCAQDGRLPGSLCFRLSRTALPENGRACSLKQMGLP